MLRNTFCHIPGIGPKAERSLWSAGLTVWDAVGNDHSVRLSPRRRSMLRHHAAESAQHLAENNAEYFADRMPAAEVWRMYPEFCHSVAYVDIETTGLGGGSDTITTIALYDGERVYEFVRGINLDEFGACMRRYKLIVTFNGKTFDVPWIRRFLGVEPPRAHIDLRYVLASLGLRGGLKRCERQLGIDRGDLADVNGYFAVLLWREYQRHGSEKALHTLLAYNIADVVNLATLMPLAYNLKIKETPFHASHVQPACAAPPACPYQPDLETINRLKVQFQL